MGRAGAAARGGGGGAARQGLLDRLTGFFGEQIWGLGPSRRGRALLYRVSRIGYSAARGFVEHRVTIRAAALTYYSVLSVVPFLAFAFAVLKGLGAYDSFVEGTVRPYLAHTFGGNRALAGAIDQVLRFVDHTNLSTLGALGCLVLVYTSVSLLSSIESALNEIWGARAQRSLVRQLTDYVTLLVTTPLLILVATTFATAAQSSSAVEFLRDTLGLGPVIDFLLRFTSVVVVGLAFFVLYVLLPNVHVRPTSALLGAAVAAVLWQAALELHVRSQVGVASYNALYSVLSAVPIFLVWTYASWLVVLVGAQVAASHQNEPTARLRFHARKVDQALRETLALAVSAHVALDFLTGRPAPSAAAMAELVAAPVPVVEDVLEALERSGIVARVAGGPEPGYLPARDPEAVRVVDVEDAVRRERRADPLREEVARRLDPPLARLLEAEDAERRASAHDVTLRALADQLRDTPALPTLAPRPQGAS